MRGRRKISIPATCDALEPRRLLAVHTWTGATGSGLWSAAWNWAERVAPRAGETDVTLVFPNHVHAINDIADLTVDRMELGTVAEPGKHGTRIGGRGFTLSGATVAVRQAPNVPYGAEIYAAVTLVGNNRLELQTPHKPNTAFEFKGAVSGGGGLTIGGTGECIIRDAQTYTGPTVVTGSAKLHFGAQHYYRHGSLPGRIVVRDQATLASVDGAIGGGLTLAAGGTLDGWGASS